MKSISSVSKKMGLFVALSIVSIAGVHPGAQAQTARHHHRSFAQKHPTATAIGAGVGAYALAKHTGHNRMRAGRRPNIMQRHPVATGVIAGMAAHHMAKKHHSTGH